MWMSLLIILLCIQRSLTIEPVKENVRIDEHNDAPKYEKNVKEQNIGQSDTQEIEYEDEDLGDHPDIDMNISSGTNNGKFNIKNKKSRNNSSLVLPKFHKIFRLIRAASSKNNSAKIEEVDPDMEEEEEFEDSEISGSTEEQEEAESYDSVLSTNRGKLIAVSERSKRLTINTKKGTESSSPDLIEIGEDESLNENDEDYDDFLPTRKESVTVRTRQRRLTSKGLANREIASASSKRSKSDRAKDNIRVGSDETEHITKKSVLHGKKGKMPRVREKRPKTQEECDFEELKKAYNAVVCSVEKFMDLANKSIQNKLDDICRTSTTMCQILPTVATYCKNDSTRSTFDWCPSSTSKLECITTCDDSDFDSGERFRKSEEDDEGSVNLKKKHKALKMEYPTSDDNLEKPGVYVYNDYDGVDPNEYDTNVPVKSTLSSPSLISRPMQLSTFQITESGRNETYLDRSKNMSLMAGDSVTKRDVPSTPRISYDMNDVTKEPKMTWSTFHFETKLKMRPSRRQARRMSTEIQKILSRRKYHFTRHREQKDVPKEVATQAPLTRYPILKNAPPGHEGDTEIIEVEYV